MRRFFNKKSILALKFLSLFLIVLSVVYLVINGPALYQKLKYKIKGSNFDLSEEIQMSEAKFQTIRENRLIIPKISVDAPIVFLESIEDEEITKELENGVVHWPDTALPGEEGNCVITGHSSSPWWRRGQYKTIFALLNELTENDLIIIYYDQSKFTYKVIGKDIVSFKNIEILSQNKKEPFLTLYTCWPLGTDLRRLVVEAELVE